MIDQKKADEAVGFFSYLAHTKGEWAGKQFALAPWQEKEIVRPLFGTVNDIGLRQYRTALIGVPRKNGKSTLSAGIALKLLFADREPGAEVYSCAGDRDQAAIVFEMAKAMIESSPKLIAKKPRIYKRVVELPNGNVYKVLSADAYTKHGLSPHGVIFDELHAQPNRELYDTMTTGQGARRQPLTVAITTAGSDAGSLCFELYTYGLQVLNGALDDPSFFFRWWGAEYEDDYRDEAVWARANPNLGVSPTLEFLRAEVRQAERSPGRQNTVRRLYLNQWVRQDVRWIDLELWDENAGLVVEEELDGRDCFGGLDLASTADFAALVLLFPPDGAVPPATGGDDEVLDVEHVEDEPPADDSERFQIVCRFWLPSGALERRSSMREVLEQWRAEGLLHVTDGDVLDYGAVFAEIDELASRFRIVTLGYDRWNASQLVHDLDDGGIECVGVAQTCAQLNAPSRELERLLGSHLLAHGGHPILRWMADNVTVKSDPSDNIKPDKKKSTEKIDGIVALVMSIGQWLAEADAAPVFAVNLGGSA